MMIVAVHTSNPRICTDTADREATPCIRSLQRLLAEDVATFIVRTSRHYMIGNNSPDYTAKVLAGEVCKC